MTGQISLDPDVGTLAGTEMIPVVSGGANKRTSPSSISTFLASTYRAFFPNGQQPGIASATAAAAGNVGELLTATVLVGSAVSLTSTSPASVTSLSLTAGDWDVWGVVWFAPAGTTTSTQQIAWVSTASALVPTVPSVNSSLGQSRFSTAAGLAFTVQSGAMSISVASTTTVFLGALGVFANSTMSAYGTIWARRRR